MPNKYYSNQKPGLSSVYRLFQTFFSIIDVSLAVEGRQAPSWPCQKERKERHTNPISLRLFLVRVE